MVQTSWNEVKRAYSVTQLLEKHVTESMQVHADVHHAHRLSERTKKAIRHLYCPPRADEAYNGRQPDPMAQIRPYQIHRTAWVRTFSSDGRCPRVRFDSPIGRAGALGPARSIGRQIGRQIGRPLGR